jgi:predicted nucleic acid-binding Zn finger protein
VWRRTLDPVITVHHDQVFFEAFSNDQSTYARLSAPLDAFDVAGEVRYGTTNIDFNPGLRSALAEMRSSRTTELRVGGGGFGVATTTGGMTSEHFERKVDVPDAWVKGFLQVQGALAMPMFTFDVRPVDLLTAIAFVDEHRPPSLPHGMRFQFQPDAPISLVLEPWEQAITLRGTRYSGYARTVRLWGRKRLELLRDVLPVADRVTVGVIGRGLPHLYVCSCGPYRFTLVLSGWTRNDWSKDAAFDLQAPRVAADDLAVSRVYAYLGEHLAATPAQVTADTQLPRGDVEQILFQLCRAGRAIAEPASGRYRLRELFAHALDVDQLFAPDPRLAAGRHLVDAGRVTLVAIYPPDQHPAGKPETRANATVQDGGTIYDVIVSVDGDGRLRFGRCGCPFFQANIMSRGPCQHIMAARLALDAALAQPAASRAR